MIRQQIERIPERVRLIILTLVYGVIGGLGTIAFMLAMNRLSSAIWPRLAALSTKSFLLGSFAVVVGTSLIAGILMALVCPSAAGSGVPQLKSAYWSDLGVIPFRAVVVKFIGGVLTLAGGSSLGREGPSVFISSGLCSNVGGWLGIDRRKRRHAAATGATAGLAAAFNTPMAAIAFVLEEVLGDLGSRLLGSVMVASIAGAFIVHAIVGRQPSFFMPSVDSTSWELYAVVPVAAAAAAFAGVVFHRGTLGLRLGMRNLPRVPDWMRPMLGAIVVWALGCGVFLLSRHAGEPGRLGVFGLGYEDLSSALKDGIGWKIAGLLAVAKLLASIASYGSGGCGGIFSPTLFIGAMCGFLVSGVASIWIPLGKADHLVLAAVGMSACFGAVVRAPVTAVLMIFEMTHQFGMVPALLLGGLISQGVARLAGREGFYDEVLKQDGHEVHKIIPPRNIAAWRTLPVSSFASKKPVSISGFSPEYLRKVLRQYPYRCFPVIVDGEVKGTVTRDKLQRVIVSGIPPDVEKPVIFHGEQTLDEIDKHLIQSDIGLFLVAETEGGAVTGVFTLHDLLRAQAAVMD